MLHSLLVQAGETLPSFSFSLEDLTEYAGQLQYEQPMSFDDAERGSLRDDVRVLREFVLRRIAEIKGA